MGDYDALVGRHAIHTGTRRSDPSTVFRSLYHRILDDAWESLPKALRAIHVGGSPQVAVGQADVERGRHPLARLIAHAVGFPVAGRQVPVRVEFFPQGLGERWTRTFAGRSFTSVQFAGRRSSSHLLRERFGALTFDLALVIDGSTLRFVVRRWSMWGVPLPRCLAPEGDCHETEIDDRFHFQVEIRQRFVGLIVAYAGWLEIPDPPGGSCHRGSPGASAESDEPSVSLSGG